MSVPFGCVVAGRLVQTNLQQVNETSYVFSIERANEINHLTVFLLVPFPEGYGASVHFRFPDRDFLTLGVLTNARPSAIYRLRPFAPPSSSSLTNDDDPARLTATLGLQIQPLHELEVLAAGLKGKGPEVLGASAGLGGVVGVGGSAATSGALVLAGGAGGVSADVGSIAEKVVKNLFNYLHSFAPASTLSPDTPIPLSVLQKWYEGFLGKVKRDGGRAWLAKEDE